MIDIVLDIGGYLKYSGISILGLVDIHSKGYRFKRMAALFFLNDRGQYFTIQVDI